MGKRLSPDEERKSLEELKHFMKHCNNQYVLTKTVSVEDGNGEEEHYFNSMSVILSDNSNYINVNINWEDEGFRDFSSHGLIGYYSTSFCPMEYDPYERVLSVFSKDSKKVVKIFVD